MLSDRALHVAEKRLFKKDKKGEVIEDFNGMCKRVAEYLGKTEQEKADFYWLMNNLYFLPNSPCLTNAGVKGRKNELSACYVLDVGDSIDEIYDTIKESAIIHKHGGGTGFNFSRIRPKDSLVGSTSGVASGPISFMHIFDASTEGIKQGGTRRGANMGVLRVDHPDIMDFINAKRGKNALKNFNISVAVTDEFMEACLRGGTYNLVDPHNGHKQAINAREVFDSIVENAWYSADPGILFIDRINEHNPLMGEHNVITATNPCGEQPLVPNEACGLGSINLSMIIDNTGINIELLKEITVKSTIFLNRMLERSEYPNKVIHDRVHASRKIGLGIMGWADMLIKLKIPYTSQDALEKAEEIIQTILDESVKTSHELGQAEGTFPLFAEFNMPSHIKNSLRRLGIKAKDYTPRNSTLLTIAPTGTISMLANCSSGVEPVFYFEQVERRVDTEIIHYHPLYQDFIERYPKLDIPVYYQQLDDVDVDSHVQMQATFQQYICSAVSKTVNLPTSATQADVEKVYREAFFLGCKGVTVYRDGSLDNQVISDAGVKNDIYIEPIPRPKVLQGKTYEIKTGFGDMLVTVNYNHKRPFEVICQLGKSGASETAKAEAVGRLASTMLRCNIHPKTIIEQLEGIVGSTTAFTEYGQVKSIPDALAKVLAHHVLEDDQVETDHAPIGLMRCGDCKADSSMLYKEGTCIVCKKCGWKSCGS